MIWRATARWTLRSSEVDDTKTRSSEGSPVKRIARGRYASRGRYYRVRVGMSRGPGTCVTKLKRSDAQQVSAVLCA